MCFFQHFKFFAEAFFIHGEEFSKQTLSELRIGFNKIFF